jgi:hypothetical protein
LGNNVKNATGEIGNNYKAGLQNEQNAQMMKERERKWSGQKLALLEQYEKAAKEAGRRSGLSDEVRKAAAEKALKINDQIFQNDLKIAKNKVIMVENEQKLVSKKDLDAIQSAKNKVQEIINAHQSQQITVESLLRKTDQKIDASNKSEVKSSEEKNKAIIEARRKLIDMENSLMVDGKEKELKISAEKFTREIEDSKATGELLNNILEAQKNAADEIENKYKIKKLNDDIKFDEIVISHMEKMGQDTFSEKKKLLQKQMDAEKLAGGDLATIDLKYQYLSQDLETENQDKKVELFKKGIAKQSEVLMQGYAEQELQLNKDFLLTKQTADDKLAYENKLSKLKLVALLDVNQQTIDALKKELAVDENGLAKHEMSVDKRAELSKHLKDLEIANENAVTDATIKNNDDKVKSDKDAIAKRIEIVNALGQATNEIFGAIADFAIQQSEQRVAGYEKEQEASDKTFEKQQGNLDNALMSDENRAEKQKKITEDKAAADKVIADKIQAEKIKQAKWQKAQAIINALIGAGLAVISALNAPPPLSFISAAAASILATIQVATIIAQPLPAYAEGTDNHPGGLSLWGEVRPEIAVTPSGEAFLAETPMITNFDAGTKIYKSVSDYENFIGKQAVKEFSIDYDKFGELMPKLDVKIDAGGLLTVQNKQGSRRTVINRRCKLG